MRVGGFDEAERVYAAPLDSDSLVLPHGMKVHNVEWVADGAVRFVQTHSGGRRPFFLYVGWTLPHGPDAWRSLRDKALAYTPAGTWKMSLGLQRTALATRHNLSSRSSLYDSGGDDDVEPRAVGRPSVASWGGRAPYAVGYQGHKDYGLALAWLDRGVGTVLWALKSSGVLDDTLLTFTSDHGSIDKGECYSRATSTPLFMQWPSVLRAGSVVSAPVSHLDVSKTILHAVSSVNASLGTNRLHARAAATSALPLSSAWLAHPSWAVDGDGGAVGESASPGTHPLHGSSLLSHFLPADSAPTAPTPNAPKPPATVALAASSLTPSALLRSRAIVCEAGHTRSIRLGQWHYLFSPKVLMRAGRAARESSDPRSTAARHPGMQSVEQLYDVEADPEEARELISAHSLLLPNGYNPIEVAGAGQLALPSLTADGERASEAFAALRAMMQRDLMNVSAMCGV